jgi:hypothetical protein
MKVWREPKLSSGPTLTDEKDLRDYVKQSRWTPGGWLRFDGTIDKSGRRGTDFCVEVSAEDVGAFQVALLKHYDAVVKDLALLEGVLRKVSRLASSERPENVADADVIGAINEIATHFASTRKRTQKFKSRFRWLKL